MSEAGDAMAVNAVVNAGAVLQLLREKKIIQFNQLNGQW